MAEHSQTIISLDQYQTSLEQVVATNRRKNYDPAAVVSRVEARWQRGQWAEEKLQDLLAQGRERQLAAETEAMALGNVHEQRLEVLVNVGIAKFAEYIIYVGQKENDKRALDRQFANVGELGAITVADRHKLKRSEVHNLSVEVNNVFLEMLFTIYDDFEFGSNAKENQQQAKVAALNITLEQIFGVPGGIIAQQFPLFQYDQEAQKFLRAFANGLKAPLSAYIRLQSQFQRNAEMASLAMRLPSVEEDQVGADLVIYDRASGEVITYVQVKSEQELRKPQHYVFQPQIGESMAAADIRAQAEFGDFLHKVMAIDPANDKLRQTIERNFDKDTDRSLTRLCYNQGTKQKSTPGWMWVFMPPNYYQAQIKPVQQAVAA